MSALHSTAACQHGIDCTSDKPGHSMTFMRSRMAHAENQWLDASIVGFENDWARIVLWESGAQVSVWSHEDLRVDLEVNDLVSLNRRYGVLALGERRISVAIA
jgi:hypothetical protein